MTDLCVSSALSCVNDGFVPLLRSSLVHCHRHSHFHYRLHSPSYLTMDMLSPSTLSPFLIRITYCPVHSKSFTIPFGLRFGSQVFQYAKSPLLSLFLMHKPDTPPAGIMVLCPECGSSICASSTSINKSRSIESFLGATLLCNMPEDS